MGFLKSWKLPLFHLFSRTTTTTQHQLLTGLPTPYIASGKPFLQVFSKFQILPYNSVCKPKQLFRFFAFKNQKMVRFSLNSEIRTEQQCPTTPHPPYSWQNSNFQNIFFLNFYTFLKLHHFRIFQLFSTIFCGRGGRHWLQLLKLKKFQNSHFYGFYRRFSKNFHLNLKPIYRCRNFLRMRLLVASGVNY